MLIEDWTFVLDYYFNWAARYEVPSFYFLTCALSVSLIGNKFYNKTKRKEQKTNKVVFIVCSLDLYCSKRAVRYFGKDVSGIKVIFGRWGWDGRE